MELLEHEQKHISFLKENAAECSLFLKRNNEFPLANPCRVALFGNGGRKTIKGGTGSGDVASRFFLNAEQALEKNGFEITSKEWLDQYDAFVPTTVKQYIKEGKKIARKNKIMAPVFSMGWYNIERNYTFTTEKYDGEVCIYVLSRNSGEGNDRRNIEGDVKLSKREVEDILYLNKKFKKFMLVLNVGNVIDLTPILEVENILLLSQLGVVTGDVLVDIILGKSNPSGKLSTTWAKIEDYPSFNDFGDYNDTYYKEGLYVGYRYFTSVKKEVFFPFGFGKSYSEFEIGKSLVSVDGTKVSIKSSLKNISNHDGKEVVQVYLTKPNDRLENPFVELCGFAKSETIKAHKEDFVTLSFDLLDFLSYDEETSSYVLLKGKYVVRIGSSSLENEPVAILSVKEDVVVEKLSNKCGESGFKDLSIKRDDEAINNVEEFEIDISNIETRTIEYKQDKYIDPLMETLTNEELAYVVLGHHKSGFAAVVGSSCEHVIGGAGETVLRLPQITKSLTMADGPAGLRLLQSYGVDKKGVYSLSTDPIMENILLYLPKIVSLFVRPSNKNRHGEVFHQYTTAIPIGTALAQSFNLDFIKKCGQLVKEEMEMFNVDLWLAPALNIHRNVLCGRNFEYYSEDPFLSGEIATAMVKGVEENGLKGVTIKHFACNNQEFNRNNNNSHLSERTLREIYLKGFERVIKTTDPKAVMTSYNLINGVHTSECYELLNDILRCEWGYEGLIMSDWIASGRTFAGKSIYPAPYASNNVKAGNDLTMPGCPSDYKDILKALKKGKLSREELLYSASRIYRSILKQK